MADFINRDIRRIHPPTFVDDGTTKTVDLGEEGVYVVHRAAQRRTASGGTPATTHKLQLWAIPGGAPPPAETLLDETAVIAAGSPAYLRPANPYACQTDAAGNIFWRTGADLTGDTWQLELYVERIR